MVLRVAVTAAALLAVRVAGKNERPTVLRATGRIANSASMKALRLKWQLSTRLGYHRLLASRKKSVSSWRTPSSEHAEIGEPPRSVM